MLKYAVRIVLRLNIFLKSQAAKPCLFYRLICFKHIHLIWEDLENDSYKGLVIQTTDASWNHRT